MRGRGRCGRAADALHDGVEVCGLSLGPVAGMARLACLFALAPEQALGLQFARAAPVNTLHVFYLPQRMTLFPRPAIPTANLVFL